MIKSTKKIVYGILIVTSGASLFGAAEEQEDNRSVIVKLAVTCNEIEILRGEHGLSLEHNPAALIELNNLQRKTLNLQYQLPGDCHRLAKIMIASLPADEQSSGEITPETRRKVRGIPGEDAEDVHPGYLVLEERAIQEARAEVANARNQWGQFPGGSEGRS